jgi:hypothetical protein
MNIMIDYDNTFTADAPMWQDVIFEFLQKHRVFLVTSRGMDTPVEHTEYFVDMGIPIVYCDYYAKKDVCEKQGIKIDIWIDDDPKYIIEGFRT